MLDRINTLRVEEKEADLVVQLEAFDECKHRDEEMLVKLHPTLDINSHTGICRALEDRVRHPSVIMLLLFHSIPSSILTLQRS